MKPRKTEAQRRREAEIVFHATDLCSRQLMREMLLGKLRETNERIRECQRELAKLVKS